MVLNNQVSKSVHFLTFWSLRCALFSLNPIEVETLTCEWCWTVPALKILACLWTLSWSTACLQDMSNCAVLPYNIYMNFLWRQLSLFIYHSRWSCCLKCVCISTVVTMNSCVPFPSRAWIHMCTYVYMFSCVERCLSTSPSPDKGVTPNFCKQDSETQKKRCLGRSRSVGRYKKQNNSFILPTGAALEQMLPSNIHSV
jgi:hypothetical protein